MVALAVLRFLAILVTAFTMLNHTERTGYRTVDDERTLVWVCCVCNGSGRSYVVRFLVSAHQSKRTKKCNVVNLATLVDCLGRLVPDLADLFYLHDGFTMLRNSSFVLLEYTNAPRTALTTVCA